MNTTDDEAPSAYSRQVGERLRVIRKQKRMSLQEVEAQSQQEFKASVLGAYERGERALSVPRLDRLSQFYAVPVEQLLPREVTGSEAAAALASPDSGRFTACEPEHGKRLQGNARGVPC